MRLIIALSIVVAIAIAIGQAGGTRPQSPTYESRPVEVCGDDFVIQPDGDISTAIIGWPDGHVVTLP